MDSSSTSSLGTFDPQKFLQFVGPEQHEQDFINIIKDSVQPGWTCVDVGGCVGDYSFLFASRTGPTGKVYCFESFPNNAKIITERVFSLNATNIIQVINAAVTDGLKESVTLHPGRDFACQEWNIHGQDINGNQTPGMLTVPAVGLDRFFFERQKPNIIKIDVEGVAAQVLRGARNTIRQQRPVLLIETHNDTEWQAIADLKSLNYHFWNAVNDSEIDPSREARCFHVVGVCQD